MAENMGPSGATGGDDGGTSAQITLSDTHLQKLAALMHESFQHQLTKIVKESFRDRLRSLLTLSCKGCWQGYRPKLEF